MALELAFIVGPLLAAGLATAWTPLAGMIVSAAFYCVAAIGFATAPASRAWRPEESVERTRAGALRSPGIRTLVVAAACAAVAFGALEVALTAFAEEQGSRDAVGPLITVWSIGSLVGGLVYGARTWSSPAPRRFLILSGLLGLGAVPLPFAGSLIAMGAFLFGTGLALAPLGATAYAAARDAGARRHRDRGVLVAHRRQRGRLLDRSVPRRPLDRPRERGLGARERVDRVRRWPCWSAWPAAGR